MEEQKKKKKEMEVDKGTSFKYITSRKQQHSYGIVWSLSTKKQHYYTFI